MTREEAIEIFKRLKENAPNEMHLETVGTAQELFDMAIKALSQEPYEKCEVGNPCLYCKHEFSQTEPCDDMVSREAVIEILGNYGCTNREGLIFKDIRALPSVTQKSGKWIKSLIYENTYNCSKCGSAGYDTFKYCPNCGAKMAEPQERSGKE